MTSVKFTQWLLCYWCRQKEAFDPLGHPHWSLFFNHQLTPVSRSQTAPSSMPQLTCGTIFLLLLVFLISLVHSVVNKHLIPKSKLSTWFSSLSTRFLCFKHSPSPSLSTNVIAGTSSSPSSSPPSCSDPGPLIDNNLVCYLFFFYFSYYSSVCVA